MKDDQNFYIKLGDLSFSNLNKVINILYMGLLELLQSSQNLYFNYYELYKSIKSILIHI